MQKIISSIVTIVFLLSTSGNANAQFTLADSIRGSYGTSRDWWDVTKYDISVYMDIVNKSISGKNIISFTPIKSGTELQIDLQDPMIMDAVSIFKTGANTSPSHATQVDKIDLNAITKKGNGYFIPIKNPLIIGENYKIELAFHGKPREAKNPPWDGGFIWKKDAKGNPWVSVACQGLGASVWYPCKDHQADEPSSAALHITIPDALVAVSNGQLIGTKIYDSNIVCYSWAVENPINSYNIIPYIGKYKNFSEIYAGEEGPLKMDYWVLDGNEAIAKKQFKDATRMMEAFEHWFGPYPFYKDGYKLVESPHLGMEHQSGIAYGNKFKQGYSGRDLSHSGWGLKFDFIIVHESGHEWFGNNITSKDIADMWIHESFTNYSETLFTDYFYGKAAGNAYVIGTRQNIENDIPIIGPYNVNKEGSGDMYYKGGNMIHMIRQVMKDDEKFRRLLRDMNKTFYHGTVTTRQIEDFIIQRSGYDFQPVFDQYLRTTQIPNLEIVKLAGGKKFKMRFTNCNTDFTIPLKIKGTDIWITPTTKWCTTKIKADKLEIDENFYITTTNLLEKQISKKAE